MRRFERFGNIGERGLTRVREITGTDRTGRPEYRQVAICATEEDAAKIADALEWNHVQVSDAEKLLKEIKRLRERLTDAERCLADIDSGFPDYRQIAAGYFKRAEEKEHD